MLLERLQFFNGQRLAAADLQSIDDLNRQMRWLHNQSLHQPGVGSGYAIAGKKGDREVTIQPGYAIDSLGREIVLTDAQVLAVPPVANDGAGNAVVYDLAVSYPADTDLVETETRDGVCVPGGAVRRREAPVFCWIRLDKISTSMQQQLDTGQRIRLARAEVLNCQLNAALSVAQRRNARPASRPYVASGTTNPQTESSPASDKWTVSSDPKTAAFGIELQRHVDTRGACFRTAPCYTARISGSRIFPVTSPRTGPTDLLLDGFVSVLNATVTGFDVLVLIPAILMEQGAISLVTQVKALLPDALGQTTASTPKNAVRNDWRVVWVGVEG
jgi:hypothetical protein